MQQFGQTKTSDSPIEKYLTWKGSSEGGFFSYYDKEAGENKTFELKDFIILNIGYTIKGWHDESESGIYSNEINSFGVPLTVKAFKGGNIASGIYKEIKADILSAGGKLHIAVTAMASGELIEFFLKGSAYFNFSEFLKEVNINSNKIQFEGFTDDKKGSVKFRTPIFKLGAELKNSDTEDALKKVKLLNEYIDSKDKKESSELDSATETETEEKDKNVPSPEDLPF